MSNVRQDPGQDNTTRPLGSLRSDQDQGQGQGQGPGRGRSAPGRRHLARRVLSRPGRAVGLAAAVIAAVAVLIVALSAVQLLPRFRNPFAEHTVDRSQPALLKSITALSRYEAASGSFQVIVDLAKRSSFLPSFLEGSDTLFVGVGTDIAYVDFSHLNGKAIVTSKHRTAVTVTVPPARLEPVALNVKRSYVFAEQQGLLNKIGNFFSSNPDSQQQVYVAAQRKIADAARHSSLLAQADKNTRAMLTGLLHSLGFKQVTVIFSAKTG